MSTQSLERTLPHNIDAEKSVLGCILVNNENYYRVIEVLRPEDFYLNAHRVIYRQMVELIDRSKVIDLITIQEELVRASQLESAGGITYLAGLLDGIPHLVNIEHYIEIIREKALLRQMVNSANKIMAECFDQAEPAEEILDRAEQALFSLSEKRIRGGFVSAKDMELPAPSPPAPPHTPRPPTPPPPPAPPPPPPPPPPSPPPPPPPPKASPPSHRPPYPPTSQAAPPPPAARSPPPPPHPPSPSPPPREPPALSPSPPPLPPP